MSDNTFDFNAAQRKIRIVGATGVTVTQRIEASVVLSGAELDFKRDLSVRSCDLVVAAYFLRTEGQVTEASVRWIAGTCLMLGLNSYRLLNFSSEEEYVASCKAEPYKVASKLRCIIDVLTKKFGEQAMSKMLATASFVTSSDGTQCTQIHWVHPTVLQGAFAGVRDAFSAFVPRSRSGTRPPG